MKSYISDFIRRAEILARVFNGGKLSKADLAFDYKVAEITINRDLSELRKLGIQLFSKNGILKFIDSPDDDILQKVAADYLPLVLNSSIYSKHVQLLKKTNKKEYFPVLVFISKAIKDKFLIEFKYRRITDNAKNDYLVAPVSLLAVDLNWILYGYKLGEDILKTFYLSRISSIKLSNKKFALPAKNKNLDKEYKIIFRFNPLVKEEINSKVWFEEFTIEEDKEGYIILTTLQPITNRLSSWCISWWDKLEIIEPVELKNYIEEMIKAFHLKNQNL